MNMIVIVTTKLFIALIKAAFDSFFRLKIIQNKFEQMHYNLLFKTICLPWLDSKR